MGASSAPSLLVLFLGALEHIFHGMGRGVAAMPLAALSDSGAIP